MKEIGARQSATPERASFGGCDDDRALGGSAARLAEAHDRLAERNEGGTRHLEARTSERDPDEGEAEQHSREEVCKRKPRAGRRSGRTWRGQARSLCPATGDGRDRSPWSG